MTLGFARRLFPVVLLVFRVLVVSLEDLDRLQKSGEQVILLDVRTDRSMETSESMAQGAVRMPPEHVVEQAREFKLPKDAWLLAYCA